MDLFCWRVGHVAHANPQCHGISTIVISYNVISYISVSNAVNWPSIQLALSKQPHEACRHALRTLKAEATVAPTNAAAEVAAMKKQNFHKHQVEKH